MKKLISLSLSLSLLVSACCLDSYVALADLLIKAFDAPEEIVVGQVFDVVTKLINEKDEADCADETLAAGSTSNIIEVYRQNASSQWVFVGLDTIPQAALNAGNSIDDLISLSLNLTGDYRFDYYADAVLQVAERSEDNNTATDGTIPRLASYREQLQGSNNHKSLFIKVLPRPDGSTEITGKAIVEFL